MLSDSDEEKKEQIKGKEEDIDVEPGLLKNQSTPVMMSTEMIKNNIIGLDECDTLLGEIQSFYVERAAYMDENNILTKGELVGTNYKIVFRPLVDKYAMNATQKV